MSGTITVAPLAAGGENNDIEVIFKKCAPFTDCISEINKTHIDNAKDIYIVIPMYNLIEYCNNYSKTSRSLWQYYRDELAFTDADAIDTFPGNNASFKIKQKSTGKTRNNGTKAVEMIIPLKYLSNFLKTLEMPLIN